MSAEELVDQLLADIAPCPYFGWWDFSTEEEAYDELRSRLEAIVTAAREKRE